MLRFYKLLHNFVSDCSKAIYGQCCYTIICHYGTTYLCLIPSISLDGMQQMPVVLCIEISSTNYQLLSVLGPGQAHLLLCSTQTEH